MAKSAPRVFKFVAAMLLSAAFAGASEPSQPIDRQALVSRHNPEIRNPKSRFHLGNGNFAITADGTGLETFGGNTLSHWSWHSFPLPDGVKKEDVVPWAAVEKGRIKGATSLPGNMRLWYAYNPHPLNLGRLGFVDEKGNRIADADCKLESSRMDLWSGLLVSRFTYRGSPVEVETCVDPKTDSVAVRVVSPMWKEGKLQILLDFPAPSKAGNQDPRQTNTKPWAGDFSNPQGHQTAVLRNQPGETVLRRTVDETVYHVRLGGSGFKVTPAASSGSLEVVRAVYEPKDGPKDGLERDVTQAVREAVRDGMVDLPVGKNLCEDIAPGKAKQLKVTYRHDGVEQTQVIADNWRWTMGGDMSAHRFHLQSAGTDTVELVCRYSAEDAAGPMGSFASVKTANAAAWPRFWKSGGAIDLSGSKDPRWKELERRIVLSQYQMAVQSAGDYPSPENGLTNIDVWASKFHMEMTWWHLAHYALWNRWPMAEKALGFYDKIRPQAQAIARNFDYKGLMWPKATSPTGYHDGFPPEMALIWKQPHPIFFAELEYRLKPTKATLEKWKEVVFGSAEFMADYPTKNEGTGIYSLIPIWPACEGRFDEKCHDTAFELAYWKFGLDVAQKWRERLGLPREPHWDAVLKHLAPLPVQNGLYVYRPDRDDTYTRRRFDHIDPVGICGMLPPVEGYDKEIGHRTVLEFGREWVWDSTWGWDFPWMAMGAARVGEPKLAIEALLNPSRKNFYDEEGVCGGGPNQYLPGNGGLLYAVAMMAAGWDGAPDRPAPGFPGDGSWTVRYEGLKPAL